MTCVDADGPPVAGHGTLVPALLELGAVMRVPAQVEQRRAEGGSDWKRASQECFRWASARWMVERDMGLTEELVGARLGDRLAVHRGLLGPVLGGEAVGVGRLPGCRAAVGAPEDIVLGSAVAAVGAFPAHVGLLAV